MNHEESDHGRCVPAEILALLDIHWYGSLYLDGLSRVIYANRAMADFLGREQDSLADSYATEALGVDEESWSSLMEAGSGRLYVSGRGGRAHVPATVVMVGREAAHRVCLIDVHGHSPSVDRSMDVEAIVSFMGPFMDSFKHPIVVSRPDSRILWSNRMAREEFRITEEDLSCDDLLHPDTEYDVSLFNSEVIKEKEAKVDELRLRNGGVYSIMAFALHDEEGTAAIVHYMRDVSDYMRARRDAERARRRLEMASKAVGFSPIVHRFGSSVVEIENIDGLLLAPDEKGMVSLSSMLELVHEDDMGELLSALDRDDLPRGGQISIDFRARFRPGPYQWYRLLATSVVDEGGDHLTGAVFNVDDIVRAQESLRRANRQLGLLSQITGHDLRNQATAAIGFAELLRDGLPEGEEGLRRMASKVCESLANIHEQLDFARDYQQLGVHEPRWFDVGKKVESLRGEPALGRLRLLNEAEGVRIFADPLFRKVLWNLIENVARHGGDATMVRVHSPEHGALVVEDDGIGVEERMKERIFDRDVGDNTGLGLFLAREILASTGLKLSEEGVPGEGARFVIRAPPENFQPATSQDQYRL